MHCMLLSFEHIPFFVREGASSCYPVTTRSRRAVHEFQTSSQEENPPKSERYPPTDLLSGVFRQSAGFATEPAAQIQAKAQVYPGHSKAKEPVADQPLPQADVPPASQGTSSELTSKE
ncbi:hypothetical protein NQ315_012235, partial [Exocentrus adspersus]